MNHIISLTGDVWDHKTSLTLPLLRAYWISEVYRLCGIFCLSFHYNLHVILVKRKKQHCLCSMATIKNVQLKTPNYSAIGIYLLIL